ncbi:MAG: hypothetical protein K2F89_02875 [Treponemataceae bacterium]|nr:hypothetical protein [Treponemataceae bacterium]
MSVNQDALRCVQNVGMLTKGNVESGSNSIISTWKGLCQSWNQETADAAGKAACNYAIQWNNVTVSEIDAKIQKLQAEYDEKKVQYNSVKAQYDTAEQAVTEALRDIKACMGEGEKKNDYGNTVVTEVIVDHIGYSEAKKREAAARIEASRCKGQVDYWKSQMKSTESAISKAKKEKEILTKKIEGFILNIYELNLMNESVPFLLELKNSSIELTSQTQKKLFSRLFFIQNNYRKQFEKFEELLKSTENKYINSFKQTPESLNYSATRNVKAKKFKGKLCVTMDSKAATTATLSYLSKSEFILPTQKLQTAQEKIQAKCKNYELKTDRNNFTIELNKVFENEDIKNETEQVLSQCDEYAQEYTMILDEFLANGASNNKIKILVGKIKNWHLARWPKLWYKIASIFAAVVLTVLLVFGILVGVTSAITVHEFKKSFNEWTVIIDKETKEPKGTRKRFLTGDSSYRYVLFEIITEDKAQEISASYEGRDESRFIPLTDELDAWFKEILKDEFPKEAKSIISLYTCDESGNALSKTKSNSGVGVFEITTLEDGSVSEINDLSGHGFLKRRFSTR